MASSSYLKVERDIKIKERDTYIKRKQEVDCISGKINLQLSISIANVNDMTDFCSSALKRGLKGKKADVVEDIEEEKEKDTYSDSNLSSSYDNFFEESKRCQSEIEELDSEISLLDGQIHEAEQREEEERKALENA